MSVEYKAMYKCRCCGETYESGITGNSDIAFRAVLDITLGQHTIIQAPTATSVHCCESGSFGLADFIGLKRELC